MAMRLCSTLYTAGVLGSSVSGGADAMSVMVVVGISPTSSLEIMNNTKWRRIILTRATTRHTIAVAKYHHEFSHLLDILKDED